MADELEYIKLLAKGNSVRLVSEITGISYGTVCRHLRDIGYDAVGNPKPRAKATRRLTNLYTRVVEASATLEEAAKALNATKEHVSRTMSRLEVKKKWDLVANKDKTMSTGRRAELFIIRLRPKWLVRDCYNSKTGSRKSKFDLILKGQAAWTTENDFFTGGSVDVKHAPLKKEKRHGYRKETESWSFSVGNFSKGVKWAALVGYNSDKSRELAVYMVPGKLVYGHSTIRINKGKSKYNKYLIWSE